MIIKIGVAVYREKRGLLATVVETKTTPLIKTTLIHDERLD